MSEYNPPWQTEVVEADQYRCRTIITYSEGAEVRDHIVAAADLTEFYVSMSDPQINEEVVSVEPVDE